MSVLIKRRHPNDYKLVECVQNELAALGLYKGTVDGVYGPVTETAVRRFQNLKAIQDDGIIGQVTWDRLFPSDGLDAIARSSAKDDSFQARCIERLIQNARKYLGLREIGSTNRNNTLDRWAREISMPTGIPWCLSSLQGIFKETADEIGCPDPLKPDTAHCLTLLSSVPKAWVHGPDEGIRGDIGVLGFSGGNGHVYLIQGYGAGLYSSLEGNTNDDGSREGYEFCERRRKTSDPNLKATIRVPWVQ